MEEFGQQIFLYENDIIPEKGSSLLQCFSQFTCAQVCLSGPSHETWQQGSCSSSHQLPLSQIKAEELGIDEVCREKLWVQDGHIKGRSGDWCLTELAAWRPISVHLQGVGKLDYG